ncbi:DUF3618 domain-containing protein [Pseudonocardia nigra]|uniref:DUF3618 domain-containing protein n=1 Tax=Pseudonocardia nigra TaxID=1921578 RepID=UPI001C603056|nr:DUF3618 domain-containing protein [Pseudonocardia nigra]
MSADRAATDDTTAPLAPERPVVDGRAKTPEELRADVDELGDELDDERRQHIEELRAEVGETVEQLAARLDAPARVAAAKDEVVATVQDRAVGLKDRVRERPAPIAGVAVLLLLLLALRRRRARRAAGER